MVANTQINLDLLELLLHSTHKFLTEHRIEYFIDGGTLLGSLRENRIIPHDDDVDIGICHKASWMRFLKCYTEIEQTSIYYNGTYYPIKVQINDHGNMYKFFIPELWSSVDGRIWGTPTLDIFKWRKSNGIVELEDMLHRRQFKNCYYHLSELYPLKMYRIGNTLCTGARNGLPYLLRYYGKDCLELRKQEIRNLDNPLKKAELTDIPMSDGFEIL